MKPTPNISGLLGAILLVKTNDLYDTRVCNDSLANRQGRGYFFIKRLRFHPRPGRRGKNTLEHWCSTGGTRHGHVSGAKPYLKKNIFFFLIFWEVQEIAYASFLSHYLCMTLCTRAGFSELKNRRKSYMLKTVKKKSMKIRFSHTISVHAFFKLDVNAFFFFFCYSFEQLLNPRSWCTLHCT